MSEGSEFQLDRATTLNARQARSVLVCGTTVVGASDDRRDCAGASATDHLRYCDAVVRRTLKVVKCDLVLDPLPHWKLVQGPEQRAVVSASSALADDHGQVVLDALEFVESCLGCAAQKGIAAVKS